MNNLHGVGAGQPNLRSDVKIVQILLNRNIRALQPLRRLIEDGICGPSTIAAIRQFQLNTPSLTIHDGIVTPNGRTLRALYAGADGVHTGPALDEKQYLAMTLYGEARGEAHASRVAVAWVIRNRVEIGRWGNSYRSVVTARLQFTCWSLKADPKNYSAIHNPSGAAWTDCQEIARQVIAASPASDPVPGATNYYSPKTQSALHRQNPDLYDETPDWTDPPAVVVPNPPGVPETSFRFYKNV